MAVQDAPNPIIHRVTMNSGNETRKAKTKLDEILEEKETRAAMRYSAAEMEKMALEAENEAARLRGEPPKYKYGGENMVDEEAKKRDDERRQQLFKSATALINSGMEPTQVGQMLMGLTPTGTAPVVSQGMSFKDLKEIIDMVTEKKEAAELRSIVASLDKKIDDLVKGGIGEKDKSKSLNPMEFAQQQAAITKSYYDALRDLGMIREPEARTSDGKPLAVVQEENRHAERMDEIKANREHNEMIADIAGSIPERIGHGMASRYREGRHQGGGVESSGLEYKICDDCRTKIFITPQTGSKVTCPKCGAVYLREDAVEESTA